MCVQAQRLKPLSVIWLALMAVSCGLIENGMLEIEDAPKTVDIFVNGEVEIGFAHFRSEMYLGIE